MKQILDVFTESPLTLLEFHLEKVHGYVTLLPELLQVWENSNWLHASIVQQKMQSCAVDIQEIKRRIMMESTQEWFYPLTEKEVKTFLSEQTQIVKEIDRIVDLVMARKIQCPENVIQNYYGYIYACLGLIETIQGMFGRFNEMMKASISVQRQFFQRMWLMLEQSREDIAQIHREVHRDLSQVENTISILDAVFLHQIFERTNNIAVKVQQVGMLCLESI